MISIVDYDYFVVILTGSYSSPNYQCTLKEWLEGIMEWN